MSNRNLENPIQKIVPALKALVGIFTNLLSRNITIKQAYYEVDKAIIHRPKLNDDFDWTRYHLHYEEELKSGKRKHTLTPQAEDFMLLNGELRQINTSIKPLHPNHHLMYELILNLNPKSILEVGCGGGDHLRNIITFNSDINIFGVDRSEQQLSILKERHPNLDVQLEIVDITDPSIKLSKVDLIFSQAVLMHISEDGGRFQNALNNMFSAANSFVVMMENWRHHDFFHAVKKSTQVDDKWPAPFYYYAELRGNSKTRAMIISKIPLQYKEIEDYDDLLLGASLRVH